MKSALATLLTAKILIPTVAAAAAGGIAVAAASRALPSPGGNVPADRPRVSDTHVPNPQSHPSTPGSEAGKPEPSLVGLCQAYTAGAGSEHGKALDNPAFTALITAAGGKDKVTDYCVTVLAGKPGNPNPGTPPTDAPNPHPNGAPEKPAHPTGQPTDPPGKRPSDVPHPTGPPTVPTPH